MTRILLINQGHTDNNGDQAIDVVLAGFLASQGHEIVHAPYESRVEDRFDIPFDRMDVTQRIVMRMPHVMARLNRNRIRDILEHTGHVDAAVIGGGELLAGHWGFNSALLTWCRELHARNVPILLTGVSGNYLGGLNARYYEEALNLCAYVSARDHSTERIVAEKYGVHCQYAPDVVFSYTKVFPESTDTECNHICELCVPVEFDQSSFASMHLASEHDYIDYLARQLQHTEDDPRVIVTSTIMSDTQYPHHVAKELSDEYHLHAEARTGENLDQFIELLRMSSRVVSARMHACILGLLFGCAIKPIPFREKLKVFGEEYRSVEDVQPVSDASYTGLLQLSDAIAHVIH